MKLRQAKRGLALAVGMSMVLGMQTTAFAADDILRVDGKTGKIFVEAQEDGYNYESKYLYDVSFGYKQDASTENPTLSHVIQFLSTGRQEGYDARVDLDKFINSALGKKTAELWYPHMAWSDDQMDEGLLNYWKNIGLSKEAYYDETEGDEGITGDYFVYSPVDAKESGKEYPMIVLFHGGGEAAYQVETFGFCQIAASEGVILVAQEETGDDENTNKIIEAVKEAYPVDSSRIYAVGSSGGGNNSMRFSVTNLKEIAACAVMDQPVSLATRWWAAEEENVAEMQEYVLPMVYVGGTADMYGLHGMQDREFFETSEGAEDQFISGWNSVMDAFNVSDKTLTAEQRYAYADAPSNEAELYDGYPFDNVVDVDSTGTSPVYKCTMNDTEDLCLYLAVNRAHMPSGYDAENIWSFISQYKRNLDTGKSERIE
ncbi:MAG: hypothetical protein Q4D16_01185 [Eubacteriales bacterium]|nr:hypothetical protein [Eubacteriales bacterium]